MSEEHRLHPKDNKTDSSINYFCETLPVRNQASKILRMKLIQDCMKSIGTIGAICLVSLFAASCSEGDESFKGIKCDGLTLYGSPVSYEISPSKFTINAGGDIISTNIDGEQLYIEDGKLVVGTEGDIPLDRCLDGVTDPILKYIP